MRDTSLEAYRNLSPIYFSDLEQTVLVLVHGTPDQTDREYTVLAGHSDPATFRRRRSDLTRKGLIVCSGKRVCRVTGKTSHTWRVK